MPSTATVLLSEEVLPHRDEDKRNTVYKHDDVIRSFQIIKPQEPVGGACDIVIPVITQTKQTHEGSQTETKRWHITALALLLLLVLTGIAFAVWFTRHHKDF